MTLRSKVKKLNLPPDSFVVAGSGLLEELGLRDADDLDIIVSEDTFSHLKIAPGWRVSRVNQDLVCRKDDIEAWQTWYGATYETVKRDAIAIGALSFMSPESTIAWKRQLSRAKDLKDIELLEEYYQK